MFAMKFKPMLRTGLMAGLLALPLFACAADAPVQTSASTPSVDQVATAKLVFNLLSQSQYTYRPRPLDTAMSDQIFDNYLDTLDGNKQFFIAADIEGFTPWRARMGEYLRAGMLEPAHSIFSRYKQRVAERVEYARWLLDQDIFDFSGDERWYTTARNHPGPPMLVNWMPCGSRLCAMTGCG